MTDPHADYSQIFPWLTSDPQDILNLEIPTDPADLGRSEHAFFYQLFTEYLQATDAASSSHCLHTVIAMADDTTPDSWSEEELLSWKSYVTELYPTFETELHKLRTIVSGCTICQGQVNSPIYLNCTAHHAFCHVCIAGWVQEGKRTCPLCREECVPNTLEHIYIQTDTVLVESATGTFTAGFGRIILLEPDRQASMSSSGDYTVQFQVAGGIPWPDGESMYSVAEFNYNAGTHDDDPMVFFRK